MSKNFVTKHITEILPCIASTYYIIFLHLGVFPRRKWLIIMIYRCFVYYQILKIFDKIESYIQNKTFSSVTWKIGLRTQQSFMQRCDSICGHLQGNRIKLFFLLSCHFFEKPKSVVKYHIYLHISQTVYKVGGGGKLCKKIFWYNLASTWL